MATGILVTIRLTTTSGQARGLVTVQRSVVEDAAEPQNIQHGTAEGRSSEKATPTGLSSPF